MTPDEMRCHYERLAWQEEALADDAREAARQETLPPEPEPDDGPLVPRWVVLVIAVLLALRAVVAR